MKIIFITLVFLTTNIFAAEFPNLISVNGSAEKSVEPNLTALQIESFGKASSAKQAQSLQAKEYNRLKSVVEKFKIKKDDFQTENLSIQPEYVYDQKTQTNRVTGYRVSHQIKLIHRKMDEAGDLIDALTSAAKVDSSGVTLQSISWDSDKKSSIEAAAMIEAVKVAKTKAEDLARAAGVKIKSVFLIQHNTGGGSMPMFEGARAKTMFAAADSATSVAPGQIKVRSEVQMQFEIQ